MSDVNDNKQAAVQFLQMIIKGDIEEAYRKYADADGKHHNVYFPAGLPALMKAMQENQAEYPDKQLIVKNVLGDGDLVAVHSQLVLFPGGGSMVVVHLFRFDNGKIVEFWDCGQAIPADCPNSDGAF